MFRMGLLTLISQNLYNPSQTHLEVCLLRDSRSCQFDNLYLPPQGLISSRSERHWFALPTLRDCFFFLSSNSLVLASHSDFLFLLEQEFQQMSSHLYVISPFVPHHLECGCKHPLFQFTSFQLQKISPMSPKV